jgi:hypothetical protein
VSHKLLGGRDALGAEAAELMQTTSQAIEFNPNNQGPTTNTHCRHLHLPALNWFLHWLFFEVWALEIVTMPTDLLSYGKGAMIRARDLRKSYANV